MESDESQDSSVEETDEIDDMDVTEENDDTRYPIQILNIKPYSKQYNNIHDS